MSTGVSSSESLQLLKETFGAGVFCGCLWGGTGRVREAPGSLVPAPAQRAAVVRQLKEAKLAWVARGGLADPGAREHGRQQRVACSQAGGRAGRCNSNQQPSSQVQVAWPVTKHTHSPANSLCVSPAGPGRRPTWQHHAAAGGARECGGAGLAHEAAGVADHQVGADPHAAGRQGGGTGRNRQRQAGAGEAGGQAGAGCNEAGFLRLCLACGAHEA